MATLKLTDRGLAALNEPGSTLSDSNAPGLRYTCTAKGAGKWSFRFTSPITGKRRETGLGVYPSATLAEAREKAIDMARQVRDGIDPINARDAAKLAADEATRASAAAAHAASNVLTFEKAARAVWQIKSAGFRNAKHAAQWLATLETYAFPTIGAKALGDVAPQDCADVLLTPQDCGDGNIRPLWIAKAETAARTRQRMSAVFDWAVAHGHVPMNPCSGLDHLLPAQPSKATRVEHQPAMPHSALPAFAAAQLIDRAPEDVTRAAILLAILCASRSGEVRGAHWREFDLDAAVWKIPGVRMKAKRPHRVPLSTQAVDLLREIRAAKLHETIVFPSPRDQVELSDMFATTFLRRVKARSDTPGKTAVLHGFRSTFRDWASENGYSRDLAERALAHVERNAVVAAYARSDLLDQRRDLMQAWADHVFSAVNH